MKVKAATLFLYLVHPVFGWVCEASASLTHGFMALIGHGPTGDVLMSGRGLPSAKLILAP
jgi:hypothetical protein